MSKTTDMLESIGILGNGSTAEVDGAELEPGAPVTAATSETTDSEGEQLSLAEALELADGTVPQETASEEPADPEHEAGEESDLERLQREIDDYRQKVADYEAQEAEEQFEADWSDTIQEGRDFYSQLIADVTARGMENGRTRQEIDAVIKHMIYEGNGIERLGVAPGTPGYIEWQQETLINYALAKGERGTQRAQPSELERLTKTYNLTELDQMTLRRFANYPPEAREEIAKNLGAKNTTASNRQAAAEDVAAKNVAAKLTQAPAPGVPGPAQRKKEYVYTHQPSVKRAETHLFAKRLGLVR